MWPVYPGMKFVLFNMFIKKFKLLKFYFIYYKLFIYFYFL